MAWALAKVKVLAKALSKPLAKELAKALARDLSTEKTELSPPSPQAPPQKQFRSTKLEKWAVHS